MTWLIIIEEVSKILNAVTANIGQQVLVLNKGKVIAFDTHDNLLKNNDYYRDYYAIQNKALWYPACR